CGRPLTLLLAIDGDAPGLARAITALAAATGEDRAVDGAIMIVGDPAAATRFREAHPGAPAVFCDDGQISRFIVGTTPPTSGFLTLELDANAHLLARTDGWPAALKAAESADEGRLVTACAPALIVPRVFEPMFCRHLIEVYHADNEPSGVLAMEGGRMVYREDPDAKIRREHRIADPALVGAVEQRIMRRVLPEIEWAYNYRITRYEAFKVVCYDGETGGHFSAHRDNDGPDTAHRRFAITLNLNSDEYEGGELRFPEYGRDRYKPPTGGAVLFSCSLAHEALPVKRGVRYALVSFLYGSDTEIQQVAREDRIAGNT
ncbi:MAG: 2OG-Fe(II) oxygenase, partial [Pseudomonadota bacterium]